MPYGRRGFLFKRLSPSLEFFCLAAFLFSAISVFFSTEIAETLKNICSIIYIYIYVCGSDCALRTLRAFFVSDRKLKQKQNIKQTIMRRKHFLLSLLLLLVGVVSASAQKYYPTTRALTIEPGKQYMIYDASRDGDDRYAFRAPNGSGGLKHSQTKPWDFYTSDAAYIWTVEEINAEKTAAHTYYLKTNAGTYAGPGGVTNNAAGVEIMIDPWTTTTLKRGTGNCEAPDGSAVAYDAVTADMGLYVIGMTPATAGDKTLWNGNDQGGSWAKWNDAHSYALYEFGTVSAEVLNAYDELLNEVNALATPDYFALQTSYGVQDADANYECNKPEVGENNNDNLTKHPYSQLIDGIVSDDNFFHSAYNNPGSDPHYMQVNMGVPVSAFAFYMAPRNDNNRPQNITISGCNTADGTFEKIADVLSISMDNGYMSYKISSETAYQYLRFTVNKTNTNTQYFTLSEFYVLPSNDDVDHAALLNLDLVNPALYHTVTLDQIQAKKDEIGMSITKEEVRVILADNASNHAETPAYGVYATRDYNALQAAYDACTTAEGLDALYAALEKFKPNYPVFTINSNQSSYGVGKSIYDDGQASHHFKTKNIYDPQMQWVFETETATITAGTYVVTNIATGRKFWDANNIVVRDDELTDAPEGVFSFRTDGTGDQIHAQENNSIIVRWNNNDATAASAWTFEYVGDSYILAARPEEMANLYMKAEEYRRYLDTQVYDSGLPGSYPTSAKAGLQSAITAAFGVTTADAVAAAETALDNAKTAFDAMMVKPASGEIYMFVTAKTELNDGYAMVSKNNNLMWESKNLDKNNNYWLLESTETEGAYKLKNGDGSYVGASGSFPNANKTGDAIFFMTNATSAVPTTFRHIVGEQWGISINGNRDAHPNGHGDPDGAANDHYIISFEISGTAGDPSNWKLVPLSGYTVYNVVVTDNFEGGSATYNGDVAANGGFFVVANGTTPTFAAGEVEGYDGNVSIEGNTVTVTYILNKVHYQASLVEAVADAQAVLNLKGAGYPVEGAPARTDFAEAIATANTAATGSSSSIVGDEIATLEAAVVAYKTAALSSDVVMPEDGKAYIFMNILDANQKALYYDADHDTYGYYTCDVTNIEEVPLNYVFVCHKMSDGQYVFVNNWGGYSALKGNAGSVGANSNKGYTAAYDATISGHTVEKGKRFGCLAIKGNRANGNDTYYVRHNDDNAAFEQASGQIGANDANNSSDFQFIEYPYANKIAFSANIANVGYVATFSAPYNAVVPAGVTAYYATDNFTDGVVTTVEMTPLADEAIPANTGVVLISSEVQTVSMAPAAAETVAAFEEGKETNYLGNSAGADKDLSAETGNVYILANGGDGVGFYAFDAAAGATIGMNKAYLVLPATAGAVKMKFGGNVTGIEGVEAAGADNAPVYDLSGRKVLAPAKGGIYVKNGKKFIVK